VLDHILRSFSYREEPTPEERAIISASIEEWFSIRHSTEPADRDRAERAICNVYVRAGRPQPQVVWCDSPFAGAKRARERHATQCLATEFWRALYPAVARQRLHEGARGWVYGAHHRPKFSFGLLSGLEVLLQDNFAFWDRYLGRTSEAVEYGVAPLLRKLDGWALEGQHGPYWIAGWSFARRLFGEGALVDIVKEAWQDQRDRLALSEELARSCGWWFPFEDVCFVSERTSAVRCDPQTRLHSSDGFAVEYPDGWGVCAWHDTTVPSEWIFDPESVSPLHALTCPGKAERRALAEILGWDRVLPWLGATVVDEDPDPAGGTLFAGRLPDGKSIRFLRDRAGYVLRVPPQMTTAREAKRWTSSARIPGIREPGHRGHRLLFDQQEAEAALKAPDASANIMMFDSGWEREFTDPGWRWTRTPPPTVMVQSEGSTR
jgi:hypothetical protein